MDRLIGCESEEVELRTILSCIRPEDRKEIEIIIQETILQIMKSQVPVGTDYLDFSFRMKTASGKYEHIISHNIVHSVDSEKRPFSILVRYNKVDFIKKTHTMNWKVDQLYVDSKLIKRRLTKGKKGVFSDREKQIVELIILGLSNFQISNELNISIHTVITHRKNIFRKCNCHNAAELQAFCMKNRLIEMSDLNNHK
jgi:DNA-binding CsgD family transcriptional regulator